jgi:hypothetical protein
MSAPARVLVSMSSTNHHSPLLSSVTRLTQATGLTMQVCATVKLLLYSAALAHDNCHTPLSRGVYLTQVAVYLIHALLAGHTCRLEPYPLSTGSINYLPRSATDHVATVDLYPRLGTLQ